MMVSNNAKDKNKAGKGTVGEQQYIWALKQSEDIN